MGQTELDNALKELEGVLKGAKKKPSASNYSAPPKVKQEALDGTRQKLRHRNILLALVIGLSSLSFLFLVSVISFQMWERLNNPQYTGVSDTVINIIAVSVFAQVIAVVATIAKLVFKD